jgi:hypothetical protein
VVDARGCAATCKAEKGDAWFQGQLDALCPKSVRVASELAFQLPDGKNFADTGLADADSPAREKFDADFKAQMAARVRRCLSFQYRIN